MNTVYWRLEMEILKDDIVTARKRHVCNLCMLAIMPGEKYRSGTVLDGGEFLQWKEHLECSKCAKETLDPEEYEEAGMMAGAEWREHMREWRDRNE